MEEPVRVSPKEAREKTVSRSAKLICAYEEEQECKDLHLEGSVSLSEFKAEISSLPKESELIFYCA